MSAHSLQSFFGPSSGVLRAFFGPSSSVSSGLLRPFFGPSSGLPRACFRPSSGILLQHQFSSEAVSDFLFASSESSWSLLRAIFGLLRLFFGPSWAFLRAIYKPSSGFLQAFFKFSSGLLREAFHKHVRAAFFFLGSATCPSYQILHWPALIQHLARRLRAAKEACAMPKAEGSRGLSKEKMRASQ